MNRSSLSISTFLSSRTFFLHLFVSIVGNIIDCMYVCMYELSLSIIQLIQFSVVDITDCYQITSRGAQFFSKQTALSELYLSKCKNISNDGVEAIIRNCVNLTVLDLSHVKDITVCSPICRFLVVVDKFSLTLLSFTIMFRMQH